MNANGRCVMGVKRNTVLGMLTIAVFVTSFLSSIALRVEKKA